MEGVPVLRILVGSAVAALVVGVLAALVLPASSTTAAPGRGSALLAEGERTLSPDTLNALEARPNWRRARLSLASPRTFRRICTLCQWPTASERPLLGRPFPGPSTTGKLSTARTKASLPMAFGPSSAFTYPARRSQRRRWPRRRCHPHPHPHPHRRPASFAYATRATGRSAAPHAGCRALQDQRVVAQVAYIAGRYPWAVIQILNEPNLEVAFGGFSVDQTVDITVRSARAIHEARRGRG